MSVINTQLSASLKFNLNLHRNSVSLVLHYLAVQYMLLFNLQVKCVHSPLVCPHILISYWLLYFNNYIITIFLNVVFVFIIYDLAILESDKSKCISHIQT